MFRVAPKCSSLIATRVGGYSVASVTAVRFNSSTNSQPKPSNPDSETNAPKPDGEKGTFTLPFCL